MKPRCVYKLVEDEGLTFSGFVPSQAVVAPTPHAERSARWRSRHQFDGRRCTLHFIRAFRPALPRDGDQARGRNAALRLTSDPDSQRRNVFAVSALSNLRFLAPPDTLIRVESSDHWPSADALGMGANQRDW